MTCNCFCFNASGLIFVLPGLLGLFSKVPVGTLTVHYEPTVLSMYDIRTTQACPRFDAQRPVELSGSPFAGTRRFLSLLKSSSGRNLSATIVFYLSGLWRASKGTRKRKRPRLSHHSIPIFNHLQRQRLLLGRKGKQKPKKRPSTNRSCVRS